MGNTFCEMILRTIQERGISQRDLCYGLCSESTFTRYLQGERHMDRLLMIALMQRLGESPDKFSPMLTEDEYLYFEWRQKVAVALLYKDWKELELLLRQPVARDTSCNEVLQKQYYLLVSGIVQEKCYGNREEGLKALEQAISLTVPECGMGIREGIRLGVQEINILLLWQELQPDREKSYRILKGLVNYIDTSFKGVQEKSKIYPKVVAQFLPLLNQREKYYECMMLAQKAIQLVMDTGYAVGVEKILQANIEAMKVLHAPGIEEAQIQLWAWREIWWECVGVREEAGDELYLLNMWQEIELLHEVISRSRKEQGFTQKNLSEDICEPETLSRIESGRRVPYKKTYQALAKKLSLPDEYYFSTIETDSFRTLELRWKYELQMVGRQWQKADELLCQLEESLDMDIPCNRQYIEQARYLIEKGTGHIKAADSFGYIIQILRYTIGSMPQSEDIDSWPESFWKHLFTEREMSLLVQLADSLQAKGKYGQAVCLLERMLGYYRDSRVRLEFHHRTILLIYARLTIQYSLLGQWDREREYSEAGIQMIMLCENKKMLPFFLNNKADALEHLGKKEAALEFYELAYHSAKLLKSATEAVAKSSYEKLKHIINS